LPYGAGGDRAPGVVGRPGPGARTGSRLTAYNHRRTLAL